MANRRSAVFIPTHGRPDKQFTVAALQKTGYTGDLYLVLDTEDDTRDEYIRRFGRDRILTFDKAEVAPFVDTADPVRELRGVVYARNAIFDIARDLGYTHFVQMDDDYGDFVYNRQLPDGTVSRRMARRGMDDVIEAYYDFLDESGIAGVAFGQGGDYIGGTDRGAWNRRPLRKYMNAMFARSDADWRFLGRMNEDVNTYVTYGTRGYVFLTVMEIQLNQSQTQAVPGGMTELYLDRGTYQKSFISVMMEPSTVKVSAMAIDHPRIHHFVRWSTCVPRIIPERFRRS